MIFAGRLARRLRFALLAPALAAAVAAAPFLLVLLPRLLEDTAAGALADSLEVMAPEIVEHADLPPQELQRHLDHLAVGSGLRLTVITRDGTVLADTARAFDQVAAMDNHARRPEVAAALDHGQGSSVRRSATTGKSYVYAARTVTTPKGQQRILRVARPLTQMSVLRRQLTLNLALAVLVGLLAAGLTTAWLRKRLVRPLAGLVSGLERMADGELAPPVEEPRDQELARFARTVERVAGRLRRQVNAERSLRDDTERALEALQDGVLVVRADGDVLANRSLFRLLGITRSEDESPLLALERQPRASRLLEAARRAGQTGQVMLEIDEYDAPRRRVEVETRELTGLGGVLLVARDLTRAAHLERVRRDFVANVSHELKTPLAAVRGYGESLVDGALKDPTTAERFSKGIVEQSRRLEAILEDLLTLARMEDLELTEVREPVALADLVERSAGELAGTADREGVTVRLELSDRGRMVGDPVALERMVVNLLSNAVKYNRPGGVVAVRLHAESDQCILEVEDSGVGIPTTAIPRIFERFFRVDAGRSREQGGTGLGLAIVKHAAARHGGRVEVESVEGEGSRFRVWLPRTDSGPRRESVAAS